MLQQLTLYRVRRQSGITLIESLVAIVVMVFGILGILGMQLRTLTDTQTGVRRAQAIRLIEDLAERLQSQPDALNNLAAYTGTPASPVDCNTNACDPAAFAESDIQKWRATVANTLPGGNAQVFVPKGGSRQLAVMIGWRQTRYNQEGKNLTAAESAELNSAFVIEAEATGGTIACPIGLICHLQYIQPVQRCTPWAQGGGSLYCPN